MATIDIPPDLRVLCRTLSSTPPGDLPALCPVLVGYALRCGGALSASLEQRAKGQANEVAGLVHRLKTHINTLLHGKTHEGRFAGMVLVKAVTDVGGWECLRTSESWVGGLLSILQKPDPTASKELCIVTLTRIFTMLHRYPTLVREIATPRVESFAKVCLQLIKPSPASKAPRIPTSLAGTIVGALSTIVPLYPTTLRPLNAQMRAAVRPYLAPTYSDGIVVPRSLRSSSRRLTILLHYTAPKNGGAEEWARLINTFIRETHTTASQIFRGVQESWESATGFSQSTVSCEGDPRGGGEAPEQLPSWTGIRGGSQRLLGLLELMAEFFRSPTKTPVTIPMHDVTDLISRLALVLPPPPGSQDREFSMQINPSIGREEREELWSILPDIHIAGMNLWLAMVRRLGPNITPLVPEALDQAIRMFKPSHHLPKIRESCFILVRELLGLVGPSVPRITVDALDLVIQACCRDLLGAAGRLTTEKKTEPPSQNGTTRSKASSGNADAFMASQKASSASTTVPLEPAHQLAAEDLLQALLSHLPHQHVKKPERALMDRTAILTSSKMAMLASVLHPYVDKSGRHFANTMPFLVQAYPHDTDVEVLRSNLRTQPFHFADTSTHEVESLTIDDHDLVIEPSAEEGTGHDAIEPPQDNEAANTSLSRQFGLPAKDTKENHPFGMPVRPEAPARAVPAFEPLTLKRKSEEEPQANSPKRVDKGKAPEAPLRQELLAPEENASGDSDSDESVQMQGVLEDDDDDDDEDMDE